MTNKINGIEISGSERCFFDGQSIPSIDVFDDSFKYSFEQSLQKAGYTNEFYDKIKNAKDDESRAALSFNEFNAIGRVGRRKDGSIVVSVAVPYDSTEYGYSVARIEVSWGEYEGSRKKDTDYDYFIEVGSVTGTHDVVVKLIAENGAVKTTSLPYSCGNPKPIAVDYLATVACLASSSFNNINSGTSVVSFLSDCPRFMVNGQIYRDIWAAQISFERKIPVEVTFSIDAFSFIPSYRGTYFFGNFVYLPGMLINGGEADSNGAVDFSSSITVDSKAVVYDKDGAGHDTTVSIDINVYSDTYYLFGYFIFNDDSVPLEEISRVDVSGFSKTVIGYTCNTTGWISGKYIKED